MYMFLLKSTAIFSSLSQIIFTSELEGKAENEENELKKNEPTTKRLLSTHDSITYDACSFCIAYFILGCVQHGKCNSSNKAVRKFT